MSKYRASKKTLYTLLLYSSLISYHINMVASLPQAKKYVLDPKTAEIYKNLMESPLATQLILSEEWKKLNPHFKELPIHENKKKFDEEWEKLDIEFTQEKKQPSQDDYLYGLIERHVITKRQYLGHIIVNHQNNLVPFITKKNNDVAKLQDIISEIYALAAYLDQYGEKEMSIARQRSIIRIVVPEKNKDKLKPGIHDIYALFQQSYEDPYPLDSLANKTKHYLKALLKVLDNN